MVFGELGLVLPRFVLAEPRTQRIEFIKRTRGAYFLDSAVNFVQILYFQIIETANSVILEPLNTLETCFAGILCLFTTGFHGFSLVWRLLFIGAEVFWGHGQLFLGGNASVLVFGEQASIITQKFLTFKILISRWNLYNFPLNFRLL